MQPFHTPLPQTVYAMPGLRNRMFRALAIAGALTCWSLPAISQTAATPAAEPVTMTVAPEALPSVPLTEQILFQVLASEIALQRGQPGPAYRSYMSLARDTRDPRFAARATEIAYSAQFSALALDAARLWRELAPTSSAAKQIGQLLLVANGKWSEVIPIAKQELDTLPAAQRSNGILALQQLFSRSLDTAGAVPALREVLREDLQRPEAHLALAQAQLAAKNKTGALQALDVALQLQPDYEPAVLLTAEISSSDSDRATAITRLRSFLTNKPEAYEARALLGRLLVSDNQMAAAQTEFEVLLKAHPEDGQALMALALIHLQNKQYAQAEPMLVRFIALPAQTAQESGVTPRGLNTAYQYLSQIAEQRQDYAAALDWLDKIDAPEQQTAIDVRHVQLLASAGRLQEALGQLAQLQQDALTTGDKQRQNALLYIEIGILADAHDYTAASARLRSALKDHPNDTDLLYEYAMLSERMADYARMEEALRRLIKLEPKERNAYNALGYSLADRNERLPEALALIEKAIALAPQDPMIMDSLGWVKYRMGDLQNAKRLLTEAYRLRPDPEIGAHLGEVLWRLGENTNAQTIWREAEALDRNNAVLKKTQQRFLSTPGEPR